MTPLIHSSVPNLRDALAQAGASPGTLDDLAQETAWPKRLLGLEAWTPPRRDADKLEKEYWQDTYAPILAAVAAADAQPDIEVVFDRYCSAFGSGMRYGCLGDDIYRVATNEAVRIYHTFVASTIIEHARTNGTIVELGAGIGLNLALVGHHLPGAALWGGEYLEQVSAALTASRTNDSTWPTVSRFDLNNAADYSALDALDAPVTVFTAHAISQLNTAQPFVDHLARHRDAIDQVIHIEPIMDHYDDTMLGLLRRSYMRANSYNQDLRSVLAARDDLSIIEEQINVYGDNALNPLSVIRWRFVQ